MTKLQLWQSLRRITSGGRYVPEIDGLRFIAITSVLLYHVAMMSEIRSGSDPPASLIGIFNLIFQMQRGVPIFFAVSGFVIGLPFARYYILSGPKVRLDTYFMRRITRLEPPYILNLLLLFPLVLIFKHVAFRTELPHLLASLVYMHWAIYGAYPTVHPPSWSLEVEVQFYILAPLIAALYFRRNTLLRRSLLIASIVSFSVLRAHVSIIEQTRFSLSLPCFASYFLAGVLVADLYLTVLPRLRTSWLWDAASIPLWLLVFQVDDTVAAYLLPWAILILFPAAFKGPLSNRFFCNRFVATTGGMCYSIYLTHSLVLQAAFAVFSRLGVSTRFGASYLAGLGVALPLVMLVGVTFFVLVERPCMDRDWPRKLLAALRGRPEVSVAR